jgi:hypothetical protein
VTDLPADIAALADRWQFVPTEELPGGQCSRVFASETLVLKVPFQGEELTYGVPAALKLQSVGGPRVLCHYVATGALLMERLCPGTTLAESSLDEKASLGVFVEAAARSVPSTHRARCRYETM